jgi:hypothetical protein
MEEFSRRGAMKEVPKMPSPTQQTKRIRKGKDRPNKANRKEDRKRMQKNLEILAKAAK